LEPAPRVARRNVTVAIGTSVTFTLMVANDQRSARASAPDEVETCSRASHGGRNKTPHSSIFLCERRIQSMKAEHDDICQINEGLNLDF
jgi:hypothetical protein